MNPRLPASNKSNNTENKNLIQQNISNCDSSSGVSSSSATSLQKSANIFGGAINGDGPTNDQQHYHQLWQDDVPAKAIIERDFRNVNGEGSEMNFNNSIKGTGRDGIEGHIGQILSEKNINGNQTLNSANINQTFVTQGSKTTG